MDEQPQQPAAAPQAPAAQPQQAAPQPAAAPQAPAQPAADPAQQAQVPQTSPQEQVGFHKGALSTLAKERQELARMIGIVEQLMQMHVQALKGLGVDLEAMAAPQGQAPAAPRAPASSGKPIDELLNQ